jgi:hypothetical protein
MGCISAGGAHAMPYFTKKGGEQQLPIFSNVTRATKMPFSNYSNTTSSFQLFIPSETMSSGSRLMHNSSKTTGSNQDMLEMKKYGRRPMTMFIPIPKGLRE